MAYSQRIRVPLDSAAHVWYNENMQFKLCYGANADCPVNGYDKETVRVIKVSTGYCVGAKSDREGYCYVPHIFTYEKAVEIAKTLEI